MGSLPAATGDGFTIAGSKGITVHPASHPLPLASNVIAAADDIGAASWMIEGNTLAFQGGKHFHRQPKLAGLGVGLACAGGVFHG